MKLKTKTAMEKIDFAELKGEKKNDEEDKFTRY